MFEGREYLMSDSKYLKLDIELPYEEMLNEARSLREEFIPYRLYDSSNTSWHSLPVVGISSHQPYAWNVYNYKNAKEAAHDMKWTEISEKCPVTTEWLKSFYPSNSYARVRFMLLEAHGSIDYHKDTEYSVLGAVNIALSNHPECKWHWKDGESLAFKPGEAYAMNISYEHSVINNSDEDRYHLIIHHYDCNEKCKELFLRSMRQQNVQGYFYYSTELF